MAQQEQSVALWILLVHRVGSLSWCQACGRWHRNPPVGCSESSDQCLRLQSQNANREFKDETVLGTVMFNFSSAFKNG